jgi:serralysin
VDAWFDRDGYLAAYSDARAANIDPLEHYRQVGWREGHNPSAAFNTNFYLKAHPEVAAAGINPLDHFLHIGRYDDQLSFSDGHWMI